jgi:hypothetical protein
MVAAGELATAEPPAVFIVSRFLEFVGKTVVFEK